MPGLDHPHLSKFGPFLTVSLGCCPGLEGVLLMRMLSSQRRPLAGLPGSRSGDAPALRSCLSSVLVFWLGSCSALAPEHDVYNIIFFLPTPWGTTGLGGFLLRFLLSYPSTCRGGKGFRCSAGLAFSLRRRSQFKYYGSLLPSSRHPRPGEAVLGIAW